MDESVRAIHTDIQAFKNIRTQLFQMENDIKLGKQPNKDNNKYFLIFFHLFESVVNNTSRLVDRYSNNLISQCPKEVVKIMEQENKEQKVMTEREKKKPSDEAQGQAGGEKEKSSKKQDKTKSSKDDKINLFNRNFNQLITCKKRIDHALQSM